MYQLGGATALNRVRSQPLAGSRTMNSASLDAKSVHLVIATMLREEGRTGVHTHARQLRRYLAECGSPAVTITLFSWSRMLAVPVFGFRLPLELCSRSAGVASYRHWHSLFLTRALRLSLAEIDDCVVYAQDPPAARSAMQARQGPHQRVALAVHFRTSQADESADMHQIERDGSVYRGIRELERNVIPQVDGMVFVSAWARNALLSWLPDAAAVPYAVIDNFVAPHDAPPDRTPLADLVTVGHLEPVENHRYMLRIGAETKQAVRNVSLDIFGDGPFKHQLVGLTRSLRLDGQVASTASALTCETSCPATARTRTFRTPSRPRSRSSRRWRPACRSLRRSSGLSPNSATTASRRGSGRSTTLPRAASILMKLLDDEPTRLAAAHAAAHRFGRAFDAEVIAPRLRSFLLGRHPGRAHACADSWKAGRR